MVIVIYARGAPARHDRCPARPAAPHAVEINIQLHQMIPSGAAGRRGARRGVSAPSSLLLRGGSKHYVAEQSFYVIRVYNIFSLNVDSKFFYVSELGF